MYKVKRGKSEVKTDFGSTQLYDFYKSVVDNPISRKKYIELVREYNDEILKLIIYDGLDYLFHWRLGSLRIRKRDNSLKLGKDGEVANKLKVDWPKTHKFWAQKYPGKSFEELKEIKDKPLIYYLNEHSDGVVGRWFWDKITCNIPNQSAYTFRPVRARKREAAQVWKRYPKLFDLYYE